VIDRGLLRLHAYALAQYERPSPLAARAALAQARYRRTPAIRARRPMSEDV
jgi:hypothetical protein